MFAEIELNNAVSYKGMTEVSAKSPLVEIFTNMVDGKPVGDLNGKLADRNGKLVDMNTINNGVERIRNLAKGAGMGIPQAMAELCEVRRFAIEPKLQEELKLLNFMGRFTPVGFGDSVEREVTKHIGKRSRVQANSGDVVFAELDAKRYAVPFMTVSGGWAVNYRKMQQGDMSKENEGMNQTRIDIRNKAATIVVYTIFNAVMNASGVHFTSQGAGITQTALDNILTEIRRFGDVGISGDMAVVQQINRFQGFRDPSGNVVGVSPMAMNEERRTGYVGQYLGAGVVAIDNPFDLTKPLPDNSSFETYLPKGLLFIVPRGTGENGSVVESWTRGGLTSFVGHDVATGQVMTRMDLEVACDVAQGREFEIGLIHDENFGDITMPR